MAPGRRGWWRIVGLATVLTGLACLANPYGLTGALYPLQLARTMGNPMFAEKIAELTPIPLFIRRSVGLRSLPLQLHIATMALGALSFLLPLFWTVSTRFRPSDDGAGAEGRKAKGKPKPKGAGGKAKASRRSKARGTAEVEVDEGAWRLSPMRFLLFAAFSALSWRGPRNSH